MSNRWNIASIVTYYTATYLVTIYKVNLIWNCDGLVHTLGKRNIFGGERQRLIEEKGLKEVGIDNGW